MDAAHLILILNKITKSLSYISPVISIHDCFGTLPNNMIDLESLVKKEFINLYANSEFLETFNKDLLAILEKYKVYHEIDYKENKVKIIIEKSINSNLPFITSQLKKNKFEEICFWLHPKTGKLDLNKINYSDYLKKVCNFLFFTYFCKSFFSSKINNFSFELII